MFQFFVRMRTTILTSRHIVKVINAFHIKRKRNAILYDREITLTVTVVLV